MGAAIAGQIRRLRESISEIAARAGRKPEEVRFILVTKNVPVEKIREAFDQGMRDFGESRIQEWLKKKDCLPPGIHWHFIGRMQSNKVKYFMEAACGSGGQTLFLHSLDRSGLALEIDEQAKRKGVGSIPCLIQVNASGEKTKAGFLPEEVPAFVRSLPEGSSLRLCGLMTIGPLTEDREKIRGCFRQVKNLHRRLQEEFKEKDWQILSMGMSSDYDIAIEEGSTMLRIGTAVFGSREKGGGGQP